LTKANLHVQTRCSEQVVVPRTAAMETGGKRSRNILIFIYSNSPKNKKINRERTTIERHTGA